MYNKFLLFTYNYDIPLLAYSLLYAYFSFYRWVSQLASDNIGRTIIDSCDASSVVSMVFLESRINNENDNANNQAKAKR